MTPAETPTMRPVAHVTARPTIGRAARRLSALVATLGLAAVPALAQPAVASAVTPAAPIPAAHAAAVPASTSASTQATRRPACTITSSRWKGVPRFYTSDTTCYTSPWFPGAHRIMIGYGCNNSPWYSRTALCPHSRGFHHGVDFDMPVGTPVRSAVSGIVVPTSRLAGPAYGKQPVIIRSGGHDILLAHLSRRAVHNGQKVRPGQVIGWSGMSGVENEDGPHLHIEVRPAGLGYLHSVRPWAWIHAKKAA